MSTARLLYIPALFFLTLLLLAAAPCDVRADEDDTLHHHGLRAGKDKSSHNEPERKTLNQYSTRYKKGPVIADDSIGLIGQENYAMHFVYLEGTADNEAILRLTSLVAVSGCAKLTPPEVEKMNSGPVMWFQFKEHVLALDKSTRYSHGGCDQTNKSVTVDLILNIDEIRNEEIKRIAFRSISQADIYDIELSQQKITLLPKSTRAFKPVHSARLNDPLTYWFFPKNTLILSVPGANDTQELDDDLKRLAGSLGLTLLAHDLIGFEPPIRQKNSLYVVDHAGRFASKLKNENGSAVIGKVQGSETFLGANGPEDKPLEFEVYAKTSRLVE